MYYNSEENKNNIHPIKIGSVVVFRDTAGLRFDLIKDSRLLRQYDILGIVDNDNNWWFDQRSVLEYWYK